MELRHLAGAKEVARFHIQFECALDGIDRLLPSMHGLQPKADTVVARREWQARYPAEKRSTRRKITEPLAVQPVGVCENRSAHMPAMSSTALPRDRNQPLTRATTLEKGRTRQVISRGNAAGKHFRRLLLRDGVAEKVRTSKRAESATTLVHDWSEGGGNLLGRGAH